MNMEEIYQKMKGAVEAASGVKINSGGDMSLRLYAVAAELFSLWTQADWLEKQSFPQTATGDYLDFHAESRALQRRSGTCASGIIRFEVSGERSDNIIIPAATVCISSAGLEFLTNKEAVIPAGETFCIVPATARNAGSFGNVPEGSIYTMALAPAGVSRCYNPAEFSGGADEESDTSLRSRVLASYARLPNGSNVAYYESAALNTEGVAAVNVLPRARGIGTVDVVVSSIQGKPDQSVIDALKEKFEREREICVDVEVYAPMLKPVDVSVAVESAEGCEPSAVIEKVTVALNALFDGSLLGKKLLLARIGNVVYGVDGVANYKITAPAEDLDIEDSQLPVAGQITVVGR